MTRRIILIKPCCIGDVVFATALLTALQRGYPDARLDWAVSTTARGAVREHPALSRVLDTGPLANPASRPGSLLRLVKQLRAGHYDLAVVPDRSPLLAIATALAGIPQRAGLDSAGRGFSYTIRARINPSQIRHEADIYLDLARALKLSTDGCWARIPPSATTLAQARAVVTEGSGSPRVPLILVHPGGGVNAGMTMVEKRWPAENFAALASRCVQAVGGQIAVIGTTSDKRAIDTFKLHVQQPVLDLTNRLDLPTTAALASLAALYIGNDNGVAHLSAAAGAKVLMIFGPSDPRRYAPFVPPDQARYVWRAVSLPDRGVNAGLPAKFDWASQGATVEEAWPAAQNLLGM